MKTIQIAGFVKASYQPDIRQVTVSTIAVNKKCKTTLNLYDMRSSSSKIHESIPIKPLIIKRAKIFPTLTLG